MSSRAARLLQLLETLNRQRQAIPGSTLANKLDVSLHTLYRDIALLCEQGAQSKATPGWAYAASTLFYCRPGTFNRRCTSSADTPFCQYKTICPTTRAGRPPMAAAINGWIGKPRPHPWIQT